MKERTFKLDIFELLKRLNSPQQGDLYKNLTDEEKKGFSALIVMRWMSCTSDTQQIMLLNEFMNKGMFSLSKHPHLQMRLLQACSSKRNNHYQWLGVKGKKKASLTRDVVGRYFDMSSREVAKLNPFPPADEIMAMAEELGLQKDEMTTLKKELA